MEIAGNVFIVSGAGSGLGAATARMIAVHGGKVLALDLREQSLEELVRQAGEEGGPGRAAAITTQRCDITDEAQCQDAIVRAQTLGPVRGLVNCAGVLDGQKTLSREGPHDLAAFARVIEVNLVGAFNVLRLAAQAMSGLDAVADGERGVIVNTASVAAFDGQMGQAAYAASKGGVAAMTLPIARDLARNGIRCVAIAPGLFETPMLASLDPAARAALGSQVPFPQRLGRPAEFARLVREVIGNVMLNGEVIRLDGALRMPPR